MGGSSEIRIRTLNKENAVRMNLTKLLTLTVTFLTLSATSAWASHDGFKGNGLPKGHKLEFNLEVIAYDGANCPAGEFTNSNTHRIAVRADVNDNPNGNQASTLVRQNDIMLTAGEFQVLDGNACIDGVAAFQLPYNPFTCTGQINPDLCINDDLTFQSYEVYARLVGKPDTGVNVTTCATDNEEVITDDTDVIVCSTENYVEVRQKGNGSKPTFTNQSKALLTLCWDTDGNGTCDLRLALFDPRLEDYFWNWNTTGKAHAQLFFLAIPD